MANHREFSFEEIMNFTMNDLQILSSIDNAVKIKAWDELSKEQQSQCLAKSLHHTRDEEQSRAVDALKLDEKLRQLASTPARETNCATTTLSEMHEEEEKGYIQEQQDYYDALICEGATPLCSAKSHRELHINPGEYKDLVCYWDTQRTLDSLLGAQLVEWRKFHKFQKAMRQQNTNDWLKYQSEIKDFWEPDELGDSDIINENADFQSRLETWVEYQVYQHRMRDKKQTSLYDHQITLAAAFKALKKDYISEYKTIDLSKFLYFSLQATDSLNRTENLERLALEKLALTRDELRKISGPQDEVVEESNAEEAFLKNPTPGNATLNQIRMDIQSALSELEEIKAEKEQINLRLEFLGVWEDVEYLKSEVRYHDAMMNWIEQQRQTIASEAQKASCTSQTKKAELGEDREKTCQKTPKPETEEESPRSDAIKEDQNAAKLQSSSNSPTRRVLRPRIAAKRQSETNSVESVRFTKKQRRTDKAISKKKTLPKTPKPSQQKEASCRPSRNCVQKNSTKPENKGKEPREKGLKSTPSSKPEKPKQSARAPAARRRGKPIEVSPKKRTARKATNTALRVNGQLRRSARIAQKAATT